MQGKGEMASTSKHRKIDVDEDTLIDILPDFMFSKLLRTTDLLCSAFDTFTLIPYKLQNSNASNENGGVDFSKAYCDLKSYDKAFYLGDIFRKGIDIVIDFCDGKIPKEKHERLLIERLFNFLISINQ